MRAASRNDVWHRSRPSRAAFLVVVLLITLTAAVLAADMIRRDLAEHAELADDPAFYSLPADLGEGDPGEIIRVEPIKSAPLGSHAWRVIYHSRGLSGADTPVSAVVVIPDTAAPEHGRRVIAWGHPTTGASVQCAPSLAADPFRLIEGLHEFLLAGYAVVSTDYPGLGVEGPSSYLLGVPEANSVLDAVRAARAIEDADIGSRVILWGHSQGGQAVLFAAERARTYAPELDILGVAVAAPAADLGELMSDDIVDVSGVTITSYAIPAYVEAYAGRFGEGELSAILTDAGAAATPRMSDLCLLTQNEAIHAIAEPLIGGYVRSDPATTEPWRTLLQENSAGGQPIEVPVFVGQGLADELVDPDSTSAYVRLLCRQGSDVSFHRYTDVDHGFAAYAALPDMLAWLGAVGRGEPITSTCS